MQAVKTAPETLPDNIETLKNLLLSERELSDHYLEEKDAQITLLKQQYQHILEQFRLAQQKQFGKSGGYRVIYYLKTKTKCILVTIYSKSDQGDIASDELKHLLSENEKDI